MTAEKQYLVECNMNLADIACRTHYSSVCGNMSLLDELYGVANMALCEAAIIYDDCKGNFAGFALQRINYAIKDSLRHEYGKGIHLSHEKLDREKYPKFEDEYEFTDVSSGAVSMSYIESMADLDNEMTPDERTLFKLLAAGDSISDIAKRYSVNTGTLYNIRATLKQKAVRILGSASYCEALN